MFRIIIPNYNKAEYIDECFTSVYNQTYKNYEIILVNDGSTDNTLGTIEEELYRKLNGCSRKTP